MAQPDDMEARVTSLETEVRDLAQRVGASEHDAAAARVLAGGADRDTNDMRGEIRDFRVEMREEMREFRQATSSSFNAIREDQIDLRRSLNDLRRQTDIGFAEMRGKFDATAAGIQRITGLLKTVIERDCGE